MHATDLSPATALAFCTDDKVREAFQLPSDHPPTTNMKFTLAYRLIKLTSMSPPRKGCFMSLGQKESFAHLQVRSVNPHTWKDDYKLNRVALQLVMAMIDPTKPDLAPLADTPIQIAAATPIASALVTPNALDTALTNEPDLAPLSKPLALAITKVAAVSPAKKNVAPLSVSSSDKNQGDQRTQVVAASPITPTRDAALKLSNELEECTRKADEAFAALLSNPSAKTKLVYDSVMLELDKAKLAKCLVTTNSSNYNPAVALSSNNAAEIVTPEVGSKCNLTTAKRALPLSLFG
jgi:hypothetical protein